MYAGIDIGGTNIKYGVVLDDGSIIYQHTHPTDASRGKDAMIADIVGVIGSLQEQFPKLLSVGVGFPSVVNPHDGCVYYPPNLPGWEVVPLVMLLQERCNVPLAIDNDANVAALAESEAGAGMNASHFLYVTLGTGVGGGIIINKRIYTGERGGAGEIGHIIVDMYDEPTESMKSEGRSYRAGTLEELLGRPGLLASTLSGLREHPGSRLHAYGERLDVEDISHEVENGDEYACEVFRRAGRLLGLGIASVLAVLDMRIVVVGGGISKAHPMFLDTARATLRERALPTIAAKADIRMARFSSNAGIVGAAMLGKHKLELL